MLYIYNKWPRLLLNVANLIKEYLKKKTDFSWGHFLVCWYSRVTQNTNFKVYLVLNFKNSYYWLL